MKRALHQPEYRRLIRFLRELRESSGVTQVALAKKLRATQTYVSRVERCERRLDTVEFVAWTAAMGHDPVRVLRRFIS